MKPRLKNAEDIKEYRNELLKEQSIDPVLGIEITDPVLDHQHFPPFRCRGVLQREVNSFEGKVFNAYRRYIKHLSSTSLPDILRALAFYLDAHKLGPKHSTAINAELRVFKRAPSEIQIKILKSLKVQPEPNARKRIKQMRKLLLQDVISYDELVQKCKEV